MAKLLPTAVNDKELDEIATATRMCVCSTQPTTYTEAITTYELADVTMAGGDFTKAAGTPDGRKVTMAAKSAVPIDIGGTASHVALVRVADTTLLLVTTCTSQALTAGGTVDVPAWVFNAGAPS
jgi:hypothetical protein